MDYTTALELIGFALVAFGVGTFSIGAGVITGGLALVLVGYLMSRA